MDTLHEQGVWFIHFLQTRILTNRQYVDVFVTTPQYLADPDTLIIFMFPLLLAFNRWLACRIALAIGTVDMINNVLKWILRGERPYWWVHEVDHSTPLPPLQHHPLTCETGSGSPSGHAMTSAAVGFILTSAIIDQYVHKMKEAPARRVIENGLWTVYGVTVTMICIARLELATHFPHQVVLGAAAGLCGGWIVWHLPIDRLRRSHYIILTILMFLSAVITYFGLVSLGIDPNRTVQLALKHCADKSYVKMSTSPWHSVYRNSALIISTGIACTTQLWQHITKIQFNAKQQFCTAFLSLVAAQLLASIPYPHQPASIFYTCAFIKNSAIVFTCLLLIPLGVITASKESIKEQSKMETSRNSTGTIRHG